MLCRCLCSTDHKLWTHCTRSPKHSLALSPCAIGASLHQDPNILPTDKGPTCHPTTIVPGSPGQTCSQFGCLASPAPFLQHLIFLSAPQQLSILAMGSVPEAPGRLAGKNAIITGAAGSVYYEHATPVDGRANRGLGRVPYPGLLARS